MAINNTAFGSLKFLPRFFKLVYKNDPFLFLGNLFIRLVSSLIPIATLWVGKDIIDEVILQIGNADVQLNRLYILIAIEFGLVIIDDVINRLINLTDGLLGTLYSNASSVELIQKTAKVELQYLEDADFYDKLERARKQTSSRVSLLSAVLSQVQDFITIISLISALLYFYPILIFLLFISIIPSFLNEWKFSKSNYLLQRRWTPEQRELEYMKTIGASDITAKEVKLFGLADFISDTFQAVANKFYLANRQLAIRSTLWGSIFNIIGDAAYYGSYVFIALRTVAGAISIGELTFLAGSFNRLRLRLEAIFSRFSKILESTLYLQDYFEFIDMEFKNDLGYEILETPQNVTSGIEFLNVGFKYPNAHRYALQHISFTLPRGEKLAFVGENGAGKTTLIKLLLRLYEPTEGAILLDGTDIRHFEKQSYQKLFGAIFQDFVKYYLTAKINIAVGNISEINEQEKIKASAERSLADEIIKTLPLGYEQPLGKRFNNGMDLSGGQWQKIAIARAYMSDAPIIILDEPTSALDARSEYEVFQKFIGLTKGKTSIIISHRFSTVRMANRIIVLSGGKLLEEGSHQQLLENKSLYAELYELQAEGYKD